MSYKVIIAGSSGYADLQQLTKVMDAFLKNKQDVEILVGGAKGADALGEAYANRRGIPVRKFLPEWSKFGKSAGLRRNKIMGLHADACICFWDGKSRGTAHMIQVAKDNGITVCIEQWT